MTSIRPQALVIAVVMALAGSSLTSSIPASADVVVAVEAGELHEIVNDGPTPLILLYFGLRVPEPQR